jgi:hypothetical protein
MSTLQIFKGTYRFADAAAEANARELFARATAAGGLVIAEAFVFGAREVTIAFDSFAGAVCFQPTASLIHALAEQAKTGTVRCVYGSASDRHEERVRAHGGGARALEELPPAPVTDLELVVDAFWRGEVSSLDLPPARVAAAFWQAWRAGRIDASTLVGCPHPASAGDFTIDDLLALLRQYATREAGFSSSPRPCWQAWPDRLEELFDLRTGELDHLVAHWRELDPALRGLTGWALARRGKLDFTDLDVVPELLPRLARDFPSEQRRAGWDRVYPRALWARAVTAHVLAGDRAYLGEDFEPFWPELTLEERVRLFCFTPITGLVGTRAAIESLGDASIPVLLREADALAALLASGQPLDSWAFPARCTHVSLGLLAAGRRTGMLPVLDPRHDALLLTTWRVVDTIVVEVTKGLDANPALAAWLDAVSVLSEERRARIYLAGTSRAWFYFRYDPLPLVVRAAVRWVAGLDCEPSAPDPGEASTELLGGLLAWFGLLAVPEIVAALATKGVKRRDALTLALTQIPGPETTAALTRLATDRAKRVQQLAITALAARA